MNNIYQYAQPDRRTFVRPMNNIYHYTQPDGRQFVSNGSPSIIDSLFLHYEKDNRPKLLGIWKNKSKKTEYHGE